MDRLQTLSTEVKRHAAKQISEAAFEDDPFPHFTVFDFFPKSFYSDLVAALPTDDQYNPVAGKTSATGDDSCRLRFELQPDSLDPLDQEQRLLLAAAGEALTSQEVRSATYDKLAEGLAYRFGCDPGRVVEEAPGAALPALYRETKGYRITPHPDTRKKVVTMQVSLAADETQRDLGTEFYRRRINPAAWLEEPRGFETVKTVPFLPNAASAFVVLNTIGLKSWHGRTLLAGHHGVRNSILNIWYTKLPKSNPVAPAAAAA